MNKEQKHEYVLVNANEEIVKHLATEQIEQTDMCRCEKCFLDVCALALNEIKSNYVTSKKGQMINNAIKGVVQSKIEILVAVSRAIELVKGSPQHSADDANKPSESKE